MAELGFPHINEMVGQVDFLQMRENIGHWKYKKLDLSPVLYKEPASLYTGLHKMEEQDHGIDSVLDWKLLEAAQPAIDRGTKVKATFEVRNTDRTIGTILSNEITKVYKAAGLPDETIHFKMNGTAGQSFGAFNTKGVTLELEGDANDYFGKGLSGAKLVVYPSKKGTFIPEENIIIGNVAFYGATDGTSYIRGKAGRTIRCSKSGASVVVEGVGDHGCEYMTAGTVVILGETGRNFAAGMSGGIAYVYDVKSRFSEYCNKEMVDLDPLDQEMRPGCMKWCLSIFNHTNSSVAKFVLDDFENN
jgi:glutamate synthase (NADPH/NADH) large chain